MIVPRRPRHKRRPLLRLLPERLKRLVFVSTLYTKISRVVGFHKVNYDPLQMSLGGLVSSKEAFNLPVVFTDRIWDSDTMATIDSDTIANDRITVETIKELTPHWLRYNETWMNDDIVTVFGLVLAELQTKVHHMGED